MSDTLILKKYKVKHFIFYKIKKQQLHLSRAKIKNNNNSYNIIINNYDFKLIFNLENIIRNSFSNEFKLKSNFKDDTIIVHNHINKNILQTTINNKDTSNDEIRWCSIDLFVDNLYSFENNPNLIFYKLKAISIDYLD